MISLDFESPKGKLYTDTQFASLLLDWGMRMTEQRARAWLFLAPYTGTVVEPPTTLWIVTGQQFLQFTDIKEWHRDPEWPLFYYFTATPHKVT